DEVTPRQGDVNWDRSVDTNDLVPIITAINNGPNSIPPLPPLDSVNITSTFDSQSNTITMVDDDVNPPTGTVIATIPPIYSSFRPTWYPPSGCSFPCAPYDLDGDGYLDPVSDVTYSDFTPTSDGFDLTSTITNNSPVTTPIGQMQLSGLHFNVAPNANSAVVRDLQRGGKPRVLSGSDPDHAWQYPGRIYMPAHVIEVNGYTLGVSVQYPILEYEHTITFGTSYVSADDTWTIHMIPNKYYNYSQTGLADYNPEANLDPGESRTYTVSVRIHKPSECYDTVNDWIRTLRPYRRYFKALYGDVRYTRDATPVLPQLIAEGDDNRNYYSFTYPGSRAPNLYGWGGSQGNNGWVSVLTGEAAKGWPRTMLWSPAGRYSDDPGVAPNLAPHFTSEWDNMPAIGADNVYLSDFSGVTGNTLGLWWGHSARIPTPLQWNPSTYTPLDPDNSTHRSFAFNEMDGAVAADVGATEIGLDEFKYMPVWESYWWLQDLQDEYPGVRFITESQHCDIMHTLAPTYNYVAPQSGLTVGGSINLYPEGLVVQDFLNRGHEFWGSLRRAELEDWLGYNPDWEHASQTDVDDMLTYFSDLGFVMVYFGPVETRTSTEYNAAESWLNTIPSDLNN
ncbi:MAG: hypothetical protein ACIARR_06785, partial [Phycisphaerales bacterium JB059]